MSQNETVQRPHQQSTPRNCPLKLTSIRRSAPCRAIERVEKEPLVFQGTPPGFDHRVRELQLCEGQQDLIALREQGGISQYQLARRFGISQPAIAKLEAGKDLNVGLRTLVRLRTGARRSG